MMAHASIEEFQLSHDVIDRGGGRRIDGADRRCVGMALILN
jgi:hypothetical protein